MSYTNGGQTINKSMNGIITFDTGGGVVIEGGDVTATGITADNIICDTLQVNTSATFAGTSTFDDNLPTSVITSTTSDDQFITKAIGDTLYAGGGILADNNVWTGTNAFNTSLPTSTITTTTSTNQIAPIAVLNTLYGRLATGVTNTWLSTNVFNAILPTSTLTGTPTATQIAPVAMLDSLYGRLATATTNTWLSTNVFDAILPTSTITTTTSTNQIAPIAVLNTLYGRLATTNTWSARNTFSSGITVATDVSCNSINCASSANFGSSITVAGGVVCDGCLINPQMTMQIRGFDSTGQYLFTNAGTTTPNFRFGFDYFGNSDRLIIQPLLSTFYNVVKIKSPATTTTATNALVIENTEVSPSQINFLLNAVASTANPNVTAGDDVIYSNGGVLNLTTSSATAVGIRMSQTDIQTRANTTTLTGTTLNDNITTTNINSTTLAISGSTSTTFVNLPSTTTTFTTATANQFITKNIADTSYLSAVTGGYARLTTVDNTFTNSNSLTGTNAIINATNNIVRSKTSTDTATPTLIIENSTSSKFIKFIANASVDALNPIVRVNDAVISGDTGLCLTTDNTADSGIRITDTNVVMAGTGVIMVGTNNIAEALVTTATSDPTFRVRGLGADTKTIKFIANASVNALNPFVEDGDGVISADTTLCLTADGATETGIRILDTGVVNIKGTTVNILGTPTFNTSPTFSGGITIPVGATFTCNGSGTIGGTFNFNALPFINVDATGADLDEAMNWRTTIAQINAGITNLKAAINTWSQSNTFTSALDLRLPQIYNFAAATSYTNIGNIGYRNTSTTQLVTQNSGTPNTWVNCVTLNMPAAYGLWRYEMSVRFTGAVNGRYGVAFGSTNTTQIPESITDMCTTQVGEYWIKTIWLTRNTTLNQPQYGFMRSSVAVSPILQVYMSLCRVA